MALTWEWKEKIGEVTLVQKHGEEEKEFTINLYKGNSYLIMIHEYEEDGKDLYDLYSFFNDKAHMRRCFGLDKKSGVDNIFTEWTKVSISKKYRHVKDFVTALAEAFDNITIEIYK